MTKILGIEGRLNNFVKECERNNIKLDNSVKEIVKDIFSYFNKEKCYIKNHIHEILVCIFLYDRNNIQNLKERIEKYINIKGFTKEKSILKYGEEEGIKRWNEYREKQKITNTFEYKNKKYNISKEEFDTYNKKRACTKNNFVIRYGEEEGIKRWNEYREKQKINGSSLEWFILKYGEEEGIKKYKKINFLKSNNVECLIYKYKISKEDAIKMLEERWNTNTTLKNAYSKSSQKLFWQIYENIKNEFKNIFFAELNKEFGKYSIDLNHYCKYDFVIEDIKFCIEFQGDHYHGNPKIYKSYDKLKGRGVTNKLVEDVWEDDLKKKKTLLNYGFDLIYVWDSDYNNDSDGVLKQCLQRIQLRKAQILQSNH